MDAVKMRHACIADKQGILNINENIYDGMDFLPADIDHYLTSRNIHCYVAEVENKIVGFISCHLIENNTCYIVKGVRVSVHLQGLGMQKIMYDFASDDIRKKYDIVNRRLVVAHAPFADEKYARDRGYKILMRTRFFSFQNVKNGNLQFTTDKLLGDDEWQIIIPKHSNHCRDILYDPIILENIFKDKMLLYNFHPNKLTTKTLGTDVLDNALFTKKNNNSKNEISCISGASFSDRVKIKDGVRFHIDIYSDNVGECFLHVLHQIKHSLSFEANDTDVALMINIGYNEQLQTQLQQLLTGHLGLIPRLIDNGPTAIVLEKDDI